LKDRNVAMKKLTQLKGELQASFRKYAGLGVMSESDKELALSSTAQLDSLNPTIPVTEQIDGYYARASMGFEIKLRTLPNRQDRPPAPLAGDAAAPSSLRGGFAK
jgi:hypothetical protein